MNIYCNIVIANTHLGSTFSGSFSWWITSSLFFSFHSCIGFICSYFLVHISRKLWMYWLFLAQCFWSGFMLLHRYIYVTIRVCFIWWEGVWTEREKSLWLTKGIFTILEVNAWNRKPCLLFLCFYSCISLENSDHRGLYFWQYKIGVKKDFFI